MTGTRSWLVCAFLCLVLLLPLACSPSASQSTPGSGTASREPTGGPSGLSFAGKTVTVVVPMAAGGGQDLMTRIYIRYLSNYLPGKPTMIVRNIPGGGNIIGTNFVYQTKPDGLIILSTGGSSTLNQLVGMKAVKYDMLKMPLTIAVTTGGLFYIKTSALGKREDALKAKGIVHGGSTGASAYHFICSHEVLNFPIDKAVLAYTGTGDARRAFLSDEISMAYDSAQAYFEFIAPLVAKGEVIPFFQTGVLDPNGNVVKDPAFPADVPTTRELYETLYGKSPSGIAWDSLKAVLAAAKTYDNVLSLPPNTPDGITKAYWAASEQMVKDADFMKVAGPLVGATAQWIAGEAADKAFKKNFVIKPEIREWLRTTLPKYGMVIE